MARGLHRRAGMRAAPVTIALAVLSVLPAACMVGSDFEAAEDTGSADEQPAERTPDAGGAASDASADATTDAGPAAAPAADATGACLDPPLPALGVGCPAECTGGCRGNVCSIACRGVDACKERLLSCPAGMSCEISCNGHHACEEARVTCSPVFPCHVICTGDDACKEAIVACGAGACHLDCRGPGTCKKSELLCGSSCACLGPPQAP